MAGKPKKIDFCPECGAEFPRGRLACPECGSDAETGWKDEEEIQYQAIEIPDAWPPEPPMRRGIPWQLVAAVLALLGMLGLLFLGW